MKWKKPLQNPICEDSLHMNIYLWLHIHIRQLSFSLDFQRGKLTLLAWKTFSTGVNHIKLLWPKIDVNHLNNEGRFSGINNKYTEYKLNLQANNFSHLLQIN